MGTLEPGRKIVYERVDDVVYARYEGDPINTRWVVGEYYNPHKNTNKGEKLPK